MSFRKRFAKQIEMRILKSSFLPALLTLLFLASSSGVQAATLDAAVSDVVDKLCLYLKSKGETQISVGQFSGPPQLPTTSGPGIVKVFHKHFERNKIKVVKQCNIGLKGEYSLAKVGSDGVGVKIMGSLVDAFGDVLTDFSFNTTGGGGGTGKPGTIDKIVDEHEDVVSLLGVTAELHPEDTEADRGRDLKDAVLKPRLHISGTRCAASQDSPYQIEVLSNGRPFSIQDEEGLGILNISEGQAYVLRLYNDSPYDAAAKVSIDGLSIFTFSDLQEPDGTPKYRFYIIPSGRFIELKGWHKDNTTVNSFLITKYAKSAAATINHDQDLGTITVAFFAAWPKGGEKPADEDLTSKGSGNATGFGPPIKEVVQEAPRDVGRLRASVSLRYSK